MEYFPDIRINKTLPFATTWMGLESIVLSERNQTEKDQHLMLSLIYGILNPKQNGLIRVESKLMAARVKDGGEKGKEGGELRSAPSSYQVSQSRIDPTAQGTQSMVA